MKGDYENIVKFFSELGMLKKQKHVGFWLAGVADPDSVAEHSFRTAQIAYILGHLEGVNPEKCALICLIHDNADARIGDQNKVNARYYKVKEAEEKAFKEQVENLPREIVDIFYQLFIEKEKRNTKEGVIAQDADWLEVAIQAKEYLEQGYKGCQNWIDNVEKALETKSAKEILKIVKNTDMTNSWWQGLKKMTYKKLDKKG